MINDSITEFVPEPTQASAHLENIVSLDKPGWIQLSGGLAVEAGPIVGEAYSVAVAGVMPQVPIPQEEPRLT